MTAFDPDGDIVCAGWGGLSNPDAEVHEWETPVITAQGMGMYSKCSETLTYEARPGSNKPIKAVVYAWAKDAKGNKGWSSLKAIEIPGNSPPNLPAINHAPVFSSSSLSETKKVRPGETFKLRVEAQDPDGDTITLEQISGPGEFKIVKGKGTVSGTWSWEVPKHYWGSPWRLVAFRAKDECGGSSFGYLLVHVTSCPPRAFDTHVWVYRGKAGKAASATASLHVQDPDTPPKDLRVEFDPPKEVTIKYKKAPFKRLPHSPYYYVSGYDYMAQVTVSVDEGERGKYSPWIVKSAEIET